MRAVRLCAGNALTRVDRKGQRARGKYRKGVAAELGLRVRDPIMRHTAKLLHMRAEVRVHAQASRAGLDRVIAQAERQEPTHVSCHPIYQETSTSHVAHMIYNTTILFHFST